MKSRIYRIGVGRTVYGVIEFTPQGRVHEEPEPGQEHHLADFLTSLRDGQNNSDEGIRGWLDHHAGLRGRLDGFWVEKSCPDGSFASDDDESPLRGQ